MKGKAPMDHDNKGEASTSKTMDKEGEKKKKKKMVILKSKDGLEFKVESALVKQSGILSAVAEEAQKEEVEGEKVVRIPCNEVRGEVLDLMIKYWKHHHHHQHHHHHHNDGVVESGAQDEKKINEKLLDNWDKEFVGKMSKELLFELIYASNYLDSRKLMDLTCKTVANRIQDMTVEQVREYFDIVGDFTPEEEAKLTEEDRWAYDP